MHDFAITTNFTIFMFHPFKFNVSGIWDGKAGFKLDKEAGSVFYILPRYCKSESEIIQFRTEGCFVYHTTNAFEEGDEIVLTACKHIDDLQAISFELSLSDVPKNSKVSINEWRFNLKTKKSSEEGFFKEFNQEFPTINPNYVGIKNQFSYYFRDDVPSMTKFDRKTKELIGYNYEDGFLGGEPFFVPRFKGESEDDGYLMNFVENNKTRKSYFLIVDAMNMKLISKIKLPRRVPQGFHGTWIQQ
jgi:carotenoid cleavage dioxygenase-like enzyme